MDPTDHHLIPDAWTLVAFNASAALIVTPIGARLGGNWRVMTPRRRSAILAGLLFGACGLSAVLRRSRRSGCGLSACP